MASKFIGDHSGDGSLLSNVTASKISNVSNDTFTGTYPLVWTASSIPYTSTFLTINGATDTLNAPNISTGTLSATTLNGNGSAITGLSWANISGETANSVNPWGGLRHQTADGYIDFGPANTTWAHIYTDRPAFYFDKPIAILGQYVWHSGNDGTGSGLDADLLDGVQGSAFLRNNVATQEINGGASTSLELRCQDAGQAYLKVGRSTNGSQGTGIVEVSQDGSHGGGFYYNGDGTPAFVSGESPDTITFYRIQAGTKYRVFQYGYSSNDVSFTGSITAAGDVTAYSDARLKSDVVTFPNALDTVSRLRGVKYTKDGKPSTGVIAQEVEAVIPEVVHTADDEMGTKSVAYGNMVGVLIEAVKELKAENEALKARLDKLEGK